MERRFPISRDGEKILIVTWRGVKDCNIIQRRRREAMVGEGENMTRGGCCALSDGRNKDTAETFSAGEEKGTL